MEKKWEEDMIEGVLYEGEVEREVGQYRKEDLGEVGEEERVGEENGVNEVREEREGEGGRGEKEF